VYAYRDKLVRRYDQGASSTPSAVEPRTIQSIMLSVDGWRAPSLSGVEGWIRQEVIHGLDSRRLHVEDMGPPWRHVEIEPACGQLRAVAVIDRPCQPVVKPPGATLLTGKVAPRQHDVTLTLMSGIVHRHEAAEVSRSGHENVTYASLLPFPSQAGRASRSCQSPSRNAGSFKQARRLS